MRYKLFIVIFTLTVALSFLTVAYGQTHTPHNSRPCHENTSVCLAQVRSQIAQVRAYVKRVKPGDPVTFNPQPDPPGDPDPWYRNALQAYRNLQEEFSDLSRFPPGPCKVGKCQDAIRNAQNRLARLGEATNRSSADQALAAMKPCIDQLSKSLP